MAHEISFNALGQSEAVFGYGEKPWWNTSTLPATVLDTAVSFEDIFSIAFPWTAEMEQLRYADGALSSQHGIRRSDTKVELGVHSGSYGNIQPRDLFDFCAAFFQEYPEIPIASAIAMQGGAVLNISARLGEIDVLGSGDIHKSYLCFVNSFNGRVKAQVYKSYVRPVCMNTTKSGIATADFTMEYKHTKNVRDRIKQDSSKASQLMQAQQATDDKVKEVLEKLAKRRLKKETYVAILDDIFGESEATRNQNIKKAVTDLFADNDNNAFPAWKGTAYALFNAITNYADHERVVRVTKGKDHLSEAQIRWEGSILGEGATLKERALERILVLSDGTEVCESSPVYSFPSQELRAVPKELIREVSSTPVTPQEESVSTANLSGFSACSDSPIDSVPSDGGKPWTMYTTLPVTDLPSYAIGVYVAEQVSADVAVWKVTVPDAFILDFIDQCTQHGYAHFTETQWQDIHANRQ